LVFPLGLDEIVNLSNSNWGTVSNTNQFDTTNVEFRLELMGDINGFVGYDSRTTFDSNILKTAYNEDINKLNYFFYPKTFAGSAIGFMDYGLDNSQKDTLYRRITSLDYFDFLDAYEPVVQQQGLINTEKPIILAFRGTQTKFDIFKDIALFVKYHSNDWLDTTLNSVYNELDLLFNQLLLLLQQQPRPLYILSHSLGSYLGNYIHYKLHSAGKIDIEHKAYNPYLLPSTEYEYWRGADKREYAKQNILLNCIEGDFTTSLMGHKGIGLVRVYSSAYGVPVLNPTLDTTENGNGFRDWLLSGAVSTQPADTTYELYTSLLNSVDNHRLVIWGADTNGLKETEANGDYRYYAKDTFGSQTLKQTIQTAFHMKTVVSKDIDFDDTVSALENVNLIWIEHPNRLSTDTGKVLIDYPNNIDGISQNDALYTFSGAKQSDIYVEHRTDMIRYVSFLYRFTNQQLQEYNDYHIVKEGNNYIFASYDATGVYYWRVPVSSNLDLTTAEPLEKLNCNVSTGSHTAYNLLTQAEAKNRYKFTLHNGQYIHGGPRRSLHTEPPTPPPTPPPSPPPTPPTPEPPSPPTPPSNPWASNTDNIQYHMWVQNQQSATETRGHIGYVRIKSKFMSDLYNKTVLALNENATNANGYLTYSPKWANTEINWNDNDTQPDEHIWRIQYFGDDSSGEPLFNLTNTMSGFPFASWYLPGAYLASTLASVKIDFHRHIATGNNAPVVRTYYVKSTHFESSSDDTLGKIFSRQTQYNIDHHYGSAMITTVDTVLDTDDRMREWIFEFIKKKNAVRRTRIFEKPKKHPIFFLNNF